MSSEKLVEQLVSMCASGCKAREVETFLSEHGKEYLSRWNSFGQSALEAASISGKVKLVETLFNNGAEMRANPVTGNWPIHCAAFHGNAEVVSLLLEKGSADQIYYTNVLGESPLMLACKSGKTKVAKRLLQVEKTRKIKKPQADTPPQLLMQNRDGVGAVQLAKHFGNAKLALVLMKEGSSIMIKTT